MRSKYYSPNNVKYVLNSNTYSSKHTEEKNAPTFYTSAFDIFSLQSLFSFYAKNALKAILMHYFAYTKR